MFYVQFVQNTYPRLTAHLEQQMQLFLEKLMKNIVAFSLDLDINIHVLMSNTIEKRLFDCTIRAIKY